MPSPWWTSQSTTSARSARPLGAQHAQRDRDVVEQAVAAREVAARVVRAAAEVHPEPVRDREARRRDAAADRPPPALDQLRRPRQPEPARSRSVSVADADARHQRAVVHRLQPRPRHRLGLEHLRGRDDPSATTRSRSSAYLSIGNRWRSGSGKRHRSWVQSRIGRVRPPPRHAAAASLACANSSSATRSAASPGPAEQPLGELRAAEVQRRVVLPGRPDAAVHGDLRARRVVVGLARHEPERGRRHRQLLRLVLRRPARVVHERAGVLEPPQDLHQLVLDRLVGADRAAEREALLGVGDARLRARARSRRPPRRPAAPAPRTRRSRPPTATRRAPSAGAPSKRTWPSERVAS